MGGQIEKLKYSMKVWTVMMMILSLLHFILGAALPGAWVAMASGAIFFLLGALGFVSALKWDYKLARFYYFGLLAGIVIDIILGLVYLILGATTVCDTSISTELCEILKQAYIALGVLSIVLSIFCYGSCAYCAKFYVQDVKNATYGDDQQ